MSNLRQRRHPRDGSFEFENRYSDVIDDDYNTRQFRASIPSSVLTIVLLIIGIVLFNTAAYFGDLLPRPLLQDEKGRFVAKRAYIHLNEIVSIGPKVIGSDKNEILAHRTILYKLQAIKNNANPTNDIEIRMQTVNGSFPIRFRGLESTNVYYNVQNLIVKIGKSPQALLVNCHFDSVPTSPGASDDILNCAVMLEVLHILSQSPTKLPFSVIFLFNGAEEGQLLASHGFITQHEWAKHVKVFINLESCGAGGREILFQAGPNHPWLIEKYAMVPHPHGLVVAEEIFQNGLVASDTDFRIFRDFGRLSGLDFAHYRNGYVYHTRFDNIESIYNVLGVLQHTGDNLLALIHSIIHSKEMVAPSSKEGKIVYFDVFGFFFLHFKAATYMYINYATVVLSVTSILIMAKRCKNPHQILIYGVLSALGGLVLSGVHNLAMAFILDYKKLTLTWFSTIGFVIPLYGIPTLIICFGMALIRSDRESVGYLCWERVRSHCLSVQMLWTLILLSLTIMKIRSSFLIQLLVIFPSIACLILNDRIKSVFGWTIIYILSTLPVSLYLAYLSLSVMKLFIPMSGRINDDKNPEITISLLSTMLTVGISSYLVPLILAVRKNQKYLFILSILAWGSLLVVLSTSFVFPFTEKTPQRVFVSHVTRESHNLSGNVEISDSFFWTMNLERRGQSVLPFLSRQPSIEQFCEKFKFCGVPWPTSASFMASNRSVFTMSKPHQFTSQTHVQLTDDVTKNLKRHLSFNVTGSDHMILYISLQPNTVLNSWSLGIVPLPSYNENNMTVYFVSYYHGLKTPSWHLWLDLKVADKKPPHVDIGLTSLYSYHEAHFSNEFNNFMAQFPPFTHLIPSLSVVKYFTY
ncbi:endoplasmic reticulum metallopeptidase 1-like isoform X2 [Cimex lectularius]|uniref:FXNA-like protease n=1 Tax=Cimex lectularius TaxID=79782 RepID=A0A8I6SCU3_CIMLE|nr:endoplasmic reticulum metallopeptidase 1-like isoform X2 [Cimex lectularius]